MADKKRKTAWEILDEKEIEEFAKEYKTFLGKVKTEREAVKWMKNEAVKKGFKELNELSSLKAGDKVMYSFKNKLLLLAVIGKKRISDGFRIIGSHIDSPRIDLKPKPLYEANGMALLRTQYYGGIKKYQWVNIPLALHGVVVLKDGTKKEIIIGEDPSDPVIIIPDLAPHIAKKKQGERKGFTIIMGEELHAVIGSKPKKNAEKDRIKEYVLELLREKYGIEEEDLISADLSLVPAFKPVDVGLDRSMIAAYGHDDRSSVYTSFRALLEISEPEETVIGLFVDREEIGSEGNAGAKSEVLEYFIEALIEKTQGSVKHWDLINALTKAKAISADVDVVVNPIFKDVHDPQNAAVIGCGVVLTKYTGSGGKYSASEAHAEYVAWIRKILDENNVPWQPGTLGKVDEGGGGTIAKYLAQRGMDIVDLGPGVLSMHAPIEIVSKADIYSAYLAYKAFYTSK